MSSKIFDLIKEEKSRQEKTINLIASENYANQEILNVTGSILTNKYAEGYPGKRYYAGCQIVDQIEIHAQQMAKKLFNAEHVNVQSHSGSNANLAVYLSALNPGDTVLAMSLSAGGHLTHGHKINFSGKIFNFVSYGVSPETETIDYNEIEMLANQHKPKMIIAGASAYPRIIDFEKFQKIAQNNHALLLVDMAHVAGLIAAKLHPNPIPFADFVSSTTHKTLRGPRGAFICCKSNFATQVDKAVMPGTQGGPLVHVIAAKGVGFEQAMQPEFKKYQEQILKNAKAMVKIFKDLGYRIVSNGTDNHLFLVDVKSKYHNNSTTTKITGHLVEQTLEKCNIIVNRNLIPFDKESPTTASGIRIGTPAITTRGLMEKEAETIVNFIDEAIRNKDNEIFLNNLKKEVEKLGSNFPIYQKSL